MSPIKLHNASNAPVINSRAAERTDSLIVPVQKLVKPGKASEFDGDNPSIRIYAKAGILVPVDPEDPKARNPSAQKWLEGLK